MSAAEHRSTTPEGAPGPDPATHADAPVDDAPVDDAGRWPPDLGAVVTVFRSRLRPGREGAYGPVADRMSELARTQPGFVDFKSFVADDGERLSLIRFADRASHEAWRRHPEHVAAQREGRRHLYHEYSIVVCHLMAERTYDTTV